MEACAYKGLPRSLGVGPVHSDPIYKAYQVYRAHPSTSRARQQWQFP